MKHAAGLALVAAAFAAPGFAAETPATQFGASVDVEVVEVEVFVTDREGRPVRGLRREDFELRVGREARPIVNFYESQLAAPAAAPDPAAPPAQTETEIAADPAPAPPPRRLTLAVVLDQLHMQPAGRKHTIDRLEPMLAERLAAGDSVLLLALDRSLRVLRRAGDTHPLAEDFARLERSAPGGILKEAERRGTLDMIHHIHDASGCEGVTEMIGVARGWAGGMEHETRFTLSALQSLSAELGAQDGRKALLYVGEGMALTPGLEAYLLIEELCSASISGDSLLTELERTARAANAAQVTLYTIDPGGMRAWGSAMDERSGLSLANQAEVVANGQDTVFKLASDTGGRALLNSNQPERLLADLTEDLGSYYSLGFAPQPRDAGRSNRIRIEVRRPGLQVRHRLTWQPVPAPERLEARTLAALHLGGGATNPLGVSVTSGPSRPGAGNEVVVPLHLAVPVEHLGLLPDGKGRRGGLRILVAVQDGDGNTSAVRTVDLPVQLPASGGATTVPLTVELRLRRGESNLAVAVHDEVGRETSLLLRRVNAG